MLLENIFFFGNSALWIKNYIESYCVARCSDSRQAYFQSDVSIFHDIDPSDTVRASDLVEILDYRQRSVESLSVLQTSHVRRIPMFEVDFYLLRLRNGIHGINSHLVESFRCGVRRIFQHSRFVTTRQKNRITFYRILYFIKTCVDYIPNVHEIGIGTPWFLWRRWGRDSILSGVI